MTKLLGLPTDIFVYTMFRVFDLRLAQTFCCISKRANSIIKCITGPQQPDRTLEGKEITVQLDGTALAHYLQLLKMQMLKNHPHLMRPNKTTKTSIRDVVFDYREKKIRGNGKFGLGGALEAAILEQSPEMTFAVLAHPNAKDIPVGGPWGLGNALSLAAQINDLEISQMIFFHRNSGEMPAEGVWGLGISLIHSVHKKNEKLVKLILSHHNATDIPLNGELGLRYAYGEAKKSDNPNIISALKLAKNNKKRFFLFLPKKKARPKLKFQ